MTRALLVAFGGALGTLLRYACAWLQQRAGYAAFPVATLAVNVAGCFALGVVLATAARGALSEDARVVLAVGVCGGFTTYSSFNAEALALFDAGQPARAAAYVAATLVCGGLAGVGGLLLGRAL